MHFPLAKMTGQKKMVMILIDNIGIDEGEWMTLYDYYDIMLFCYCYVAVYNFLPHKPQSDSR